MVKMRIVLEDEEKQELSRRAHTNTVLGRDGQRAQIILLAADGYTQEASDAKAGITRVIASHWCRCFVKERLARLIDAPVRKVLEAVARPPANLER